MYKKVSCAAVLTDRRVSQDTIKVSKSHHPRMMGRMKSRTIKGAVSRPCYGCRTPMQVSKLRAEQPIIYCRGCLDVCEACGENDKRKLRQDPDSNRKLCTGCIASFQGCIASFHQASA